MSEPAQKKPKIDTNGLTLTLIKQGAEGRIYQTTFQGQPCIVKERFPKKYRHPELDKKLTKQRLNAETKAIGRCRAAGIKTPVVYKVDAAAGKIYMEELVHAVTLRDHINSVGVDVAVHAWLMAEVGRILAAMHCKNVIHGDLTTSNMMLNTPPPRGDGSGGSVGGSSGGSGSGSGGGAAAAAAGGGGGAGAEGRELIMIDFGLSSSTTNPEDRAIDLYVLERAFSSTHPRSEALFAAILSSYEANHTNPAPVLKKLEEVRARGRKRTMLG